MNLSIRCFIITGASRGLGKALKDFVINETEDHVISLSRKFESTDEINKRITCFPIDLKSQLDFSFIDFLLQNDFKQLILLNNASTISPINKIGNFGNQEPLDSLMINCISPIIFTNKLISELGDRLHAVINISTGAAKRPIENWSLYCSSKAAAKMFFDTLAIEKPTLRVSNIDPGVMDTGMQEFIRNTDFPDVELFRSLAKSGKLKKPYEAAREILSSYI